MKEIKLEKSSKSRREFVTKSGAAAGLAALAGLFSQGAQAQTMEINAMGPTPEQAQAFAQLPDRPVVMVNLTKFSRDGAGASDYAQYSEDVGKILASIGAEVIFRGECRMTFIGGTEWDAIALVRYPNSRALLQMTQSSEYQAISGSRSSGLDGQMNLAVFET